MLIFLLFLCLSYLVHHIRGKRVFLIKCWLCDWHLICLFKLNLLFDCHILLLLIIILIRYVNWLSNHIYLHFFWLNRRIIILLIILLVLLRLLRHLLIWKELILKILWLGQIQKSNRKIIKIKYLMFIWNFENIIP